MQNFVRFVWLFSPQLQCFVYVGWGCLDAGAAPAVFSTIRGDKLASKSVGPKSSLFVT